LNPDGSLDEGFNPTLRTAAESLVLQGDGRILFVSGGTLERLHPDGTLDESFWAETSGWVSTVSLQADGMILAGGSALERLDHDGSRDWSFDPLTSDPPGGWFYSLAVQADGAVLVGGDYAMANGQARSGVARVMPDGTLDGWRFRGGVGPTMSAESKVISLQQNGSVVAGGLFETLGGYARQNLGRWNNTGPATEQLNRNDSTITWLRGGTAPECGDVTFEHSLDGENWTMLGRATRIVGGWQLTSDPVSASPDFYLRARGRGIGCEAGSLYETVRQYGNRAPVAGTDEFATAQDVPVDLPASRLLSNDTDADGDTLSLVSVTDATHGTASLAGGVVTYTPVPGYTGPDSFVYQVSDGAHSSAGTVNITVRANGTRANMLDATPSGADVVVRFGGISGLKYVVQHGASVSGPWSDLPGAVTIAADSNVAQYVHLGGAGVSGFYRTRRF
jgi:hypothetical protein